MKQEKKIKTAARATKNFKYFVNEVFALSFKDFVGGSYIDKTANFLQNHDWTIRVSARDHFKSTSLYAHFMWDVLRNAHTEYHQEYHYFSYKKSMAAYHIKNIRNLVARNPYFKTLMDLKPTADGVIAYQWGGSKAEFTMRPHSMLGFKRGLHCNGGIYVDDPFQDPNNKLDPGVIRKINDIMKAQITEIPNRGAFFHVVGTPQTNQDFFFDDKFTADFETRVLPAIQDWKSKELLWDGWMSWDELMGKRESKGRKLFNQEFMCSPAYTEDRFISRKQLDKMMYDIPNHPITLESYDNKGRDVIAGWDLGKHQHPAHFTALELDGIRNNADWIQIHSKFFRNMSHNEQLEYIQNAKGLFGIDRVYYDATRGELEVLEERGELPDYFHPVNLSLKKKRALATQFDKLITGDRIKLTADEKQRRSILSVQNDLKAIETPEGHGDAFFSFLCALDYLTAPTIGVY